jgi:predicted CoA-binding protein
LSDIPISIDIVDVFRKSESIPELIPEILLIKPKVLWLQVGIRNDEAVKPVLIAGIEVIQDKCIMIEYLNCR